MSLALLFPLGLLALAAWVLPLLLHLARREQRTPTPFAALRWLAVRQKPRQRLRFDEILLLVLRLALLAALALLLARPALIGGDTGQAWEVVHPALPAPPPVAGDDVQRRWLAPGFPAMDQPRPALPVATSSLLRQLDAELAAGATLTVRVPRVFDGADGERPRLSRRVDWQVVDAAEPATPPAPAGVPRLAIRHDAAHVADAAWLQAAAGAWQAAAHPSGEEDDATDTAPVDIAPVDAGLPDGDDVVLAWLADGEIPAPVRQWIERGGTALIAAGTTWPARGDGAALSGGDGGAPVAAAAALGRGRVVQLRRPLQPAAWPALLEAEFPRTLRSLLAPPAPAPARADAATHSPHTGGAVFAAAARELFDAMAWIVLLLFALERLVATGRRPETSA